MMATDTEGFDLAFKLRNQPEYRNIPIIMVTGFTQRMAELGPEKFQHILGEDWPVTKIFEKPIDPDELMAAVETALKEQRKG
jgi:DNA-binding response OmpR family regulator